MTFDGWTPEAVETLTKLVGEGLTASEIARTMHVPSRLAVIGKARRLGLGIGAGQPSCKAPRADGWTPDETATLARLVAQRTLTWPQIGAAFGRSASACERKASDLRIRRQVALRPAPPARPKRIKLSPETPPPATAAGARHRATHVPAPAAPPPAPAAPVAVRSSKPRLLMDLGWQHCRWIITDGPPSVYTTLYCADVREAGSSYCACHSAIARGAGTPSERRADREAA